MDQRELNLKVLNSIIIAGICVAILSALETRVDWISSFCGMFGDGCRETAQYTLLKIPVSLWGIGYYILLGVLLLRFRSVFFWGVMAGVGVEIAFVTIMVAQKYVCVLCLANLLVVGLLLFFTFDRRRVWQALAMCLCVFIISDALLARENVSAVPGNAIVGKTDVVARVGSVDITTEELEATLAGRLYKLEKKIYDMKQERLDKLINTVLLEKAAKAEGISIDTLATRIISSGNRVSDEEVEEYYRKNKSRMNHLKDSEEKLKEKIRAYLVDQKNNSLIEAFTKPLKEKYGVTVFLNPPSLPLANVDITNSPFTGPANAPVTIVEFSDYMCPSCRRAHSVIKKLRDHYKGKIKWVYKDYPLKRHKGAKKLANAARCAGEQGKFWEYQDLLFEAKGEQNEAALIRHAETLGLDIAKFTAGLKTNKYMPAIEKDMFDAKSIGVSSTPSFIINGKLHPGSLSEKKFKTLIDEALAGEGAK